MRNAPKTKEQFADRLLAQDSGIDWKGLDPDRKVRLERLAGNKVRVVVGEADRETKFVVTVSKPLPPGSQRGSQMKERWDQLRAAQRGQKPQAPAAQGEVENRTPVAPRARRGRTSTASTSASGAPVAASG